MFEVMEKPRAGRAAASVELLALSDHLTVSGIGPGRKALLAV